MTRRDAGAASAAFEALGLPPSAELTDDDIRSAWRRVAAASHPDREDGGNPERFAAAAAAYTALRTSSGRGELLATAAPATVAAAAARPVLASAAGLLRRARHGRPGRLTLRLLAAATASTAAVVAGGWHPATPALITGALTWLVLTARHDLAPPG